MDLQTSKLRREATVLLSDAGMSGVNVGKVLGYSGKAVYNARSSMERIQGNTLRVYSKAHKAVLKALAEHTRKKSPVLMKMSDLLTIWKETNARIDPIVNINKNLNVNVSFTEIPMGKYKMNE